MKKIEKKFDKKGFTYKQIKRIEDKAIYEQRRIGGDGDSLVRYEVIIIKSHDGYEIGGVRIPPSEVYPSSSQWGVSGWTYTDIEDAEKQFCLIKSNGSKK